MSYQLKHGKLVNTKRGSALSTRQFGDIAKGVFDIRLVRREHMPGLIESAIAGDRDSAIIVDGIKQWMETQLPREPARLCMTCEYEFRKPDALPEILAVTLPRSREALIVTGICSTCASRPDLDAAISGAVNVEPFGACYQMSGDKLMALKGRAVLVHGVVQWPTADRGHAWLELPDGRVWDNSHPALMTIGEGQPLLVPEGVACEHDGTIWDADQWRAKCKPVERARYTLERAMLLFAKAGHWGPWPG